MLLDAAGRVLRLEASMGHRTPTFTTIVRPVQAITAVGTGRPVQSSDFLNDSRLDHDPSTDDIVRKEGMRTVLAVPLQYQDRVLGALYVGHREPRRFSPGEVDRFLALGGHVAAALHHVRRQAELSSQLESVTKQLRLAERSQSLLVDAEQVRQSLLDRVRDQPGVVAAAVALAESLDRPVIVTDWKLAPVAQAVGRSQTAPVRSHAGFLNRPESREAVAACTESHRPCPVGRDWVVAPIEAGRNLLGYAWIGPAGSRSHVDLGMVIDRVAPVIALELMTKGDSERRQWGDFIYELLGERMSDLTVLEARAVNFWAHFGQPHRPVILYVASPDEQWGSRLETARRLVAAVRPNDFVAIYGRHLVLLTTPADRHHVETTVADVRQLLERNHLSATAVVGAACRDLKHSRESTLAALRLHDLLGSSGVLWGEGLEALTHLFDPGHQDRLESLCRTALAPLARRDGLMDALHAYYEAGGNRAKASRRLSVHVNTLRQRLERAEQILGGSIDDSARAVPLRLALLVRSVTPAARPLE
jgi:hypothetical protein